jgi:class 3 adenylate cyclase/tetratricopeptide (TPR) repeat protein
VSACAACGHEIPEGAKFCPECGAPVAPAAAPREQRKTVTVLFCDVAGSTALGESTDPEALRAVLARYFERMREIVERHGGSVEKFIGDAVMAVFGVPIVHEDDALRACRAAVEMRDALPELGIRGRIGVNTGEVVTGTEERLATGDAVNVAARLEQAAEPGEVLIGAETVGLVRDAVELGAERQLELKGKSEPVAAYPLLAAAGEVSRRSDVPIVGRERERRALDDSWERVQSERACHLFTLLGAAGVGKSRLTAEFVGSLGDFPVVRGRCLSYGEGITYWPVVEVVLQLGRPSDPRAAAAIASLLGESEEPEPASADEIAWAFRKLLEESAPVVCVFDDLHWAEPTFLDLVDHVAEWSRDAPILLVCIARQELLDRRPTWAGGKLNATTVLLEPLTAEETDELIERLLGDAELDDALLRRIREAAEGNPLFVEQMLAMVADSPNGDVVVPPTIQALLAARLDQLDPSERGVLERGSVEGKIFHRGGVEALAPDEADVPTRLMALVRKELVRPDRTQLPGDDAFRFRHLLIRDAAYDGLPKAARAELHERFAVWLETHGADLIELDEILGYHLEQAHRYRIELGLPAEETEALARRAAKRLAAAGERAALRDDVAAAVVLYERCLTLLPDDEPTLEWQLRLIRLRTHSGDLAGALHQADDLIERARRDGDRPRELRVWLARGLAAHLSESATADQERPVVVEALEVFEALDDDAALAAAWTLVASIELSALQWRATALAADRAVEHAERAGDPVLLEEAKIHSAPPRLYGPTPVDEALAWFETYYVKAVHSPAMRGQLEAMRGNREAARRLVAEARGRARELGQHLWAAGAAMNEAEVELNAGDPERAAEVALDGVAELDRLGEQGWLSTVAGWAAEALYRLGRDDQAWKLTETAERAGAPDDVITQMLIRQVRAKLLVRRGELAEAERLALGAVELGRPTDALEHKAAALRDLATVLIAAGNRDEALAALVEARDLYDQKGHTVGVARVDAMRAELGATLEA